MIKETCERVGRNPDDIQLIAVTKNIDAETIKQAIDAGVTDIGENRIQELEEKFQSIKSYAPDTRIHMIGHLQSNKAGKALHYADVVHSVDSIKLAKRLSGNVLIQINTSGEETKSGLPEDQIPGILDLPNINVIGLMTIGPNTDDESKIRTAFQKLRELRDQYKFKELSMGMSNDYQIAIEEGATMLRLGSVIFNEG